MRMGREKLPPESQIEKTVLGRGSWEQPDHRQVDTRSTLHLDIQMHTLVKRPCPPDQGGQQAEENRKRLRENPIVPRAINTRADCQCCNPQKRPAEARTPKRVGVCIIIFLTCRLWRQEKDSHSAAEEQMRKCSPKRQWEDSFQKGAAISLK